MAALGNQYGVPVKRVCVDLLAVPLRCLSGVHGAPLEK